MQFFVCWENLLIFVFVLPLAAGCWLYFDFYFVSSLFDSVVVSFRLLAQKKQCQITHNVLLHVEGCVKVAQHRRPPRTPTHTHTQMRVNREGRPLLPLPSKRGVMGVGVRVLYALSLFFEHTSIKLFIQAVGSSTHQYYFISRVSIGFIIKLSFISGLSACLPHLFTFFDPFPSAKYNKKSNILISFTERSRTLFFFTGEQLIPLLWVGRSC